MKVKEVKLNIEYRFKNEIVTVLSRVRNSFTEKWYYGFGTKHQKIKHRKETTFMLNNKVECFAKELTSHK